MARTPEGVVKTAVKRLLVEHGIYYFMPVSNGMGRHGIPDFICSVNGVFLAIETKAGKGKPTALQEREMQNIVNSGGYALLINETSIDALSETLIELKERHGKINT